MISVTTWNIIITIAFVFILIPFFIGIYNLAKDDSKKLQEKNKNKNQNTMGNFHSDKLAALEYASKFNLNGAEHLIKESEIILKWLSTDTTTEMREINIGGVVQIPKNVTDDQFNDEFIDWIESKGYLFGGGIGTEAND